VWAEDILEDVADCLGIDDAARTYHGYHASPAALYLAVPDPSGAPRSCIRLEREEKPGPSWHGFTNFDFMRVASNTRG
jgi:hypothetical protein